MGWAGCSFTARSTRGCGDGEGRVGGRLPAPAAEGRRKIPNSGHRCQVQFYGISTVKRVALTVTRATLLRARPRCVNIFDYKYMWLLYVCNVYIYICTTNFEEFSECIQAPLAGSDTRNLNLAIALRFNAPLDLYSVAQNVRGYILTSVMVKCSFPCEISAPPPPSLPEIIKSGRETRARIVGWRGVCADASREAHRADRAGIRAFRAARECEIPAGSLRRSQRRTNIDSKFVRAWPARAKSIKRRPDNIFIRENAKCVSAAQASSFSSSCLVVTHPLWRFERQGRPANLPRASPPRLFISISPASCDGGCKWHVFAERSHLKWRVSNNMSVRHGGPNAIHRMINRAIGINRATFRDVERPRELCR